jgi:hypothetical protein
MEFAYMSYIGDDFKWDKLIIICYLGGQGGDFLCNLLQINFNPEHTFSPDENNKFYWKHKAGIKSVNRILNYHSDSKLLKYKNIDDIKYYCEKLYYCAKLYNAVNINDSYVEDPNYKKYVEHMFNVDFKVLEKIYDEDFDVYKKNYIQYVRNSYIDKYNFSNKNIINYHYNKPIENFSMQEMFPGAAVFQLYTNKVECSFIFKVLEIIKNVNRFPSINIKDAKQRIASIAVNTNYPSMGWNNTSKTFDNMTGINVGKLFLENGYEEEIEHVFSNQLNREIILDRNLLEKYKKDNYNIIKETMDISENIHELSYKEIVQIILENYFLDHEPMPSHKLKDLLKKWNYYI